MTEQAIHYITHPFQFVKTVWKFLELSKWRVLFLFLAWVAVCYYVYTHGGIGSIKHSIDLTAYNMLSAVIMFFATIVQVVAVVVFLWFWIRSDYEDPLLFDPMHSYHSSNIHNNDDM